MTETGRFQYRAYRRDDEPAVLVLHQRVFGAAGSSCQPVTVRHWRWKYGPQAERSASLLAVDRSTGAVVGFVGGVRVPFWHQQLDVLVIHTLDHMIDPAYRQGLQKTGLFSRLMNRWVEVYCGPGRRGLGFGFPCSIDYRIGARVAQYEQLMSVSCLVLERLERGSGRDHGLQASLSTTIPDDVEVLWRRCRVRYPMMIARTREHLRWRYESHPDIRYRVAEVRNNGRLEGLAVLRRGGVAADAVTVMDWLTPPDGSAAVTSLLAICRDFADTSGNGVLVVWSPESSPHRGELLALGLQPRPGPWLVAGRVWDPRLSPEAVRAGLILSFGDMDFL